MSNISFKGLWIPFEILTNKILSDKEKYIYSIILYLSKDDNYCNVSNRYLSEILDISITQVSKLISSLKDKKFIDTQITYKENSKEVKTRKLIPIVKNDNRYSSNIQEGYVTNVNIPPQENNKDIINNKNNINNNYYNFKQNNNRSKSSYLNYEQRQYPDGFFEQFYANISKAE